MLAASVVLLAGYTIYIYRTTVPEITRGKKIFLSAVRILLLTFLFLLIFEPLFKIEKKKMIQPVHYFFIDNSKSQKQFEAKAPFIAKNLFDEIHSLPSTSYKLFSFGNTVSPLGLYDSAKLAFTEPATNFSKIFPVLQHEENIASVTIVSDGIITEGTSPFYQFEKLNVPVFSIGVGDSTTKKDISIQNVLHNEYLYSGSSSPFIASVLQHGFSGTKASLSLFEDDVLLETKEVSFTNDEQQNVEFLYKPKTPGEKKISLQLSHLPDEYSFENNKHSLFVKVIDSKLSIVLLAGAPSADVTFMKNALEADTNNFVQSFTQLTSTQYVEKTFPDKALDKADVLYLLNFPSSQTPAPLVEKVAKLIREKKLPYFFQLTSSVDPGKLKILQSELPFNFGKTDKTVIEAQPVVSDDALRNPLLQFSGKNIIEQWNNLPPVFKPNWECTAKPESEVLAKTKINNIAINSPLIISKRLGSQRGIAILASDIWKWKLQKASAQIDLFDRFISNGTKWLHAVEQKKQVTISTNKKFYSVGEKIYFTAEVFDEAFNAVNDAEFNCKVKNNESELPISFTNIGNGLYESTFTDLRKGDYNFSGEASLNKKSLGKDFGRFSVGEIDFELQNTTMNSDLLKLLAKETKGKFFYNSSGNLIDKLKEISKNASKIKTEVNEYRLWTNELFLAFIILLFAIEWFIRKREGLT